MTKRKKTKIYFDHAATTPIDPLVLKAMTPYLKEKFGNSSSLHQWGTEAEMAINQSKEILAQFLGCGEDEVFFTSGATESNNMVIFGLLEAVKNKNVGKPEIIVSAIEHDAVLEPVKQLAARGVKVIYLPVKRNGLVEVATLRRAINTQTVLISIMYVNNEVGTIQPISEIGRLIKKLNERRKNKIYFHTDATQAINYCDCRVAKLNVDLLSLSAHKIYGPKGVGAIYIKKNTPLKPLIFGGHQQAGWRAGTCNVPGIVGLGKAVKLLLNNQFREKENRRLCRLRDYLVESVKQKVPKVIINGDLIKRAPNNASFIFQGVEGESVVLMLSQNGVAVSTGSACSSDSLEPSHILMAMGVSQELAHGSVRISLGRFNRCQEVDQFLKILPPIIERLRKISPLKDRQLQF